MFTIVSGRWVTLCPVFNILSCHDICGLHAPEYVENLHNFAGLDTY